MSSAVRNQRIQDHDLDIEYEVRTRIRAPKKRKGQTPRTWQVKLRTPHFQQALNYYEKQLAAGKQVRIYKYTIEVVREELFIGPPARST